MIEIKFMVTKDMYRALISTSVDMHITPKKLLQIVLNDYIDSTQKSYYNQRLCYWYDIHSKK